MTWVNIFSIITLACSARNVDRVIYGGVAQLARALGSYPGCHWFKSSRRYHIRPVGQVVKTPPFHGGNMGSSPVRVTTRWGSWKLPLIISGGLAQLVRALASHARGRWFESISLHHVESAMYRCASAFKKQAKAALYKALSPFPNGTHCAVLPFGHGGGLHLFLSNDTILQ